MKVISLNILASRIVVGLLQAVILFILYSTSQSKIVWFATDPSIFIPMLIIALFVPLLIIQSIGNMRPKIIVVWGAFVTLIILGISYYSVYRQILPNMNLKTLLTPPIELIFFTSTALFIAQTLIISSANDNQYIAHYSTYFDSAYKLGIQVVFAVTFTVFFWIILWLGISLFSVIHLQFFEKIVTQAWFEIFFTTLTISIALHITDVNARFVHGIRTLALELFAWLLLLITSIISLFLLSLFFTGLTPLWQTGHSSMLLLSSAAILIVLINAVYQDGCNKKSLPAIQHYSVILASYLLIPIIALAIYALSLRVQQYGWSVQRIYAAACLVIATCYSLGYTMAALMNRIRFKLIERWNIGTAFLILALYLAILTPLADPVRISVQSQLSRLNKGQISPEQFDFKALRSQGLRFGYQVLQDLQNKWQGPKKDYIRTQAKVTLKMIDHSSNANKATPFSVDDESKLIIPNEPRKWW